MTAEDFLNPEKQRYFRIAFPDFFIDSDNPFLLDANLHEVMSDNPDIAIGNLVIPELHLQTINADMKDFSGCTIQADSGIEQTRQDVTETVTAIWNYFAEENLTVRTAAGVWLAVTENFVYSVRMTAHGPEAVYAYKFTSSHKITGIWTRENSVQLNEQNQIVSSVGRVYLLHDSAPYLTYAVFLTSGLNTEKPYLVFDSQEHTVEISESVFQELLQNGNLTGTAEIGYCHLGYATPFARHIQKLYLKKIKFYDENQIFRQRILSAVCMDFALKTYGDFILKDAVSQDEETLDMYGYGILDKLSDLHAENFFRTAFHSSPETFADLYQIFIAFLQQNHLPIQPAEQNFLNLSALPAVEPDWSTADFSGLTASQILKEFAILEGGHAYINHDNLLTVGWTYSAPVLTAEAGNAETLRIGNELLTPAQGLSFLSQDCRNLIQTSLNAEEMVLPSLTNPENFSQACANIIHHFDNFFLLPFSVSILAGASPFLRTGDCIRIVTKSRSALHLPVTEQEITCFPFLHSRLTFPDGTSWNTVPVDWDYVRINGLRAENWSDFILFGNPDFSDVIVTALLRNGESFRVENQLCLFETRRLSSAYAECTVHFAGLQTSHQLAVKYPLYTSGGQILFTNQNKILAVKEYT